MSDLLTLAEVSAITRVPVETLRYYRWRDRGEGPAGFKVGRRVMFRRAEVERWLAEREGADRHAMSAS